MSNKKPRHLNWFLIAFLFALCGVTQANISTGTNTVGLQKDGHNTEQITFATLGGGTVTKRSGEQHDVTNVNRDLNNTQEITLDQQTGGLNATVTVDHRLLSEGGRNAIKEDFTKTGMIVDTVALIATTDRVGITDFFKETGKKHTTYEGIKSEIANNPDLAKQLQNPDLTPDQKEAMLDQLTHRVMVDLGYSKEGYQNIIVANDKDYVQKEDGIYQRQGFYSEETSNSYINDAFINDTKGLVTTAGHELSHAMDDRSGVSHSEKDNDTYANQFGNNFGSYTNTALGVTGNDSMASSNSHVGNNSSTVQNQTQNYNALDKNKGDDLLQFIPPLIAAGAMIISDIKVANAPSPDDNLDAAPQSVSLLPTDLAAEALNELTEHKYEMAIGIAAAVGNPKRALEDGADVVKAVSGKLGKKADSKLGAVEPLEVDSYKKLKQREVVGDALEHDHIPSAASIIRAEEKRLGRDLSPEEKRYYYNNATAVERVSGSHAQSPTYKGKNSQSRIDNDSNNLAEAACRDCSSLKTTELEMGASPKKVDAAIKAIHDRNIDELKIYTREQLSNAQNGAK